MSMPAPGDVTTWQVTSQSEFTQVNAAGAPIAGVKVYFTTGKGHEGSVFVPQNQYSTGTVRALVAAAAALMDQVGALTSGGN